MVKLLLLTGLGSVNVASNEHCGIKALAQQIRTNIVPLKPHTNVV
jgi:hypothetical protein